MAARIDLNHKVHVLTKKEELDSVRVPGKVVVVLDILFATTLIDILQVWMFGTVILGFCCVVSRRPKQFVVVEAEEAKPAVPPPRIAPNPAWVRQDQTVEPPGGY